MKLSLSISAVGNFFRFGAVLRAILPLWATIRAIFSSKQQLKMKYYLKYIAPRARQMTSADRIGPANRTLSTHVLFFSLSGHGLRVPWHSHSRKPKGRPRPRRRFAAFSAARAREKLQFLDVLSRHFAASWHRKNDREFSIFTQNLIDVVVVVVVVVVTTKLNNQRSVRAIFFVITC